MAYALQRTVLAQAKPFKSFVYWPHGLREGTDTYQSRIIASLGMIPCILGYGRASGIFVTVRYVFNSVFPLPKMVNAYFKVLFVIGLEPTGRFTSP